MINFISISNDSVPVSNDVTRFPEGDRGIDKWFGAVLTNHPLDPTGTQDKSVWAVAPMIAGNPYQPNYCANLLGPGELDIQYTDYTPKLKGPDFGLVARMVDRLDIPVFAEGRINTPEDLKIAYECGAFGAIVGSAITRPQLIAKNFVNVLKDIDIK